MTEVPYSTLTAVAMFHRYNEEAERRGMSSMPRHKRPKDRGEMGKLLALLLATPKPKMGKVEEHRSPRAAKNAEIRVVVIEELCKVAHWEYRETGAPIDPKTKVDASLRRSVGFTYAEVLIAVRARLPKSKMTGPKLRVHAAHIRNRNAGYEAGSLPDRRPHSSKGVQNG